MAIFSGKDPYWTAKRGTVQNGLVFHVTAAVAQSYPGTGNTWYDLSGRGNHGTLTGGAYYTSNNGGVINFDGTNDIAVFNLNFSYNLTTQPVSYSLWHTGTVSGAGSTLAGLSSQTSISSWLIISRSGTNNISVFNRSDASGDASVAGGTWATSNWRNLVVIRDTTNSMSLWQNGINILNLNSIGGGATTVNCFAVGGLFRGALGTTSFTSSQYDDIRIYNRVLTASEIQQNFNATRKRFGV